jgi:hypothetical protein
MRRPIALAEFIFEINAAQRLSITVPYYKAAVSFFDRPGRCKAVTG